MAPSVLILDDDVDFQSFVSTALALHGFEVLRALSGEQARTTLATRRIDAMVVDGLLPDTNGIDFIASIRADGNRSYVVFVSRWWRDLQSFHRLRELGVDRIVHKPFSPYELIAHLREVLRGQAATEPEARPEAATGTGSEAGAAAGSEPATGTAVTTAAGTDTRTESTAPRTGPAPVATDRLEGARRKVEALRRAYAEKLRERVGELETTLRSALDGDGDTARLGQAHTLAHKLHGTAATYGNAAVGDASGRVEAILDEALRDLRMPTGEERGPLFAALREAAAAAGTPAGHAPEERPDGIARALVLSADGNLLLDAQLLGRKHLIDVVPAMNETDALARAKEAWIDCAVIDLDLGGERPRQAAAALKAIDGVAQLPVAFMSTDAGLMHRIVAAHAGATTFLEKPLDPDAFVAAVRQLSTLRRGQRPRLVLVDDDPEFLRFLSALLGAHGIEAATLSEPWRILDVLEAERPELLLVDVQMPVVGGLDICRMLRSTRTWATLPILFLTGDASETTRLACYRAGGDDYLTKPVLEEELIARIRVRLERNRLLRDRADRDALTGLSTRRAFVESFAARLSDAGRHGRRLAVVLLDLDHFKRINDTHGHLAGDRVLASLGGLLQRRFRAEDLRCRWGGEEFAIAMEEPVAGGAANADGAAPSPRSAPPTGDAAGVVRRVADEFRRLTFDGDAGGTFGGTLSAGVARFPEDGAELVSLIAVADRRLYRAKENGRDRVEDEG